MQPYRHLVRFLQSVTHFTFSCQTRFIWPVFAKSSTITPTTSADNPVYPRTPL